MLCPPAAAFICGSVGKKAGDLWFGSAITNLIGASGPVRYKRPIMDSDNDNAALNFPNPTNADAPTLPGLGVKDAHDDQHSEWQPKPTAATDDARSVASSTAVDPGLTAAARLHRLAVPLTAAAAETAAVVIRGNESARAARAAAAVTAAVVVADEVVHAAAEVQLRVAESAQRVARATADAASFNAASVVPGTEAAVAREAARVALAATTEAMAVAEEAGIAAAVVAEAAGAAAVAMAETTADTEMAVELAQACGLAEVQAVLGGAARQNPARPEPGEDLG